MNTIVGDKLNYSKISRILTELYDNKADFVSMGYLNDNYFLELDDVLVMATMVDAGWVELTDLGKDLIGVAWKTLCDIRDLDFTVMHNTVMEFFMAQAVEE